MQDEQIDWLKSMHRTGMHIVWQDHEADTMNAVIGFSTERPHIMFVAKGEVTKRTRNKNGIVEIDVRQLKIADFIVLNKIEIPDDLRDPVFLSLS